jgi:hypothetical protein
VNGGKQPEGLAAYQKRKADEGRAAAAEWRERADRVADGIRARTGLDLFASAAFGGLTIRLDRAEEWLASLEDAGVWLPGREVR